MSVVVYFTFVISLCVFVVIVTIIALHLCLRAISEPVVAMPLWVSHFFHFLMSLTTSVWFCKCAEFYLTVQKNIQTFLPAVCASLVLFCLVVLILKLR